MAADIFWFAIALAAVVWSGGFLVRALARAAAFVGVSEFLVSFVLVAIATSLPELFVGIASGLNGTPSLAFGTVVGSNVVNLTLMFAIPVFIARGLPVVSGIYRRDALFTALVVMLPIVMLLDGALSRADGAVLVGLFVWYLALIARQKEHFSRSFRDSLNNNWDALKGFFRDIGVIVAGLVVLLVGSDVLVERAVTVAGDLGMPVVLLGTLVVALGTNLPELVFGVQATLHRHGGMVFGGMVGSVVANAGLVLGVTVLLSPLSVSRVPTFWVGGLFLVTAGLVLAVAVRTGRRLSVFEGLVFLSLYGIFFVTEMFYHS